jgi:hypothetical protein
VEDLTANGMPPGTYNLVHKIACFIPGQKRTDKTCRAAAKACQARAERELAKLDPALPRLYLGKWAPIGLITPAQYKAQLEIKLSKAVIRNNAMCLPHPKTPYFNAPAGRHVFRAQLARFCKYALGTPWPTWPEVLITPDDRMLAALRSMGPLIAFDIETLGKCPLTSPISAIGISDGQRTVSIPWVSYTNRHGHHTGIEKSKEATHVAIRAALKQCLESRREKGGHNKNYDIPGIQALGISIGECEWDSLDAYKILYPELAGNLEAVGAHLMTLPTLWKTEFRAGRDGDDRDGAEFTESPQEHLLVYNGRDSFVTAVCVKELKALLAEED